ncbi:MAG: hypothetical protein DRJ50_13925, partial [Actinobacteria bacterium]
MQDIIGLDSITYQLGASGGDRFINDGRTVLYVKGPGTEYHVIVANGHDCDFGEHPDLKIVSPAGQTTLEPTMAFAQARFNVSGGWVGVSYYPSAVGIEIAAVRMSA